DVEFPFRQDSDFYYLTGFPEPDAVLVLMPGRAHGEVVVFCRERDPTQELWNGYRAGPEGVCAKYGADDAFPINDMDDILPGLIEGRERVYYAMGRNADFDRRVMHWINVIRSKVRAGAHPPGEFLDLDHLLHDLRLFKSAGELRVMKEAGQISARAHCRAMTFCKPGMYEYQLEAEILHEFGRSGSRSPAYGTIVGGGANGCILHYRENDTVLRDGDLVLIDAGCELEHYAADITRTFPVNGKFSKEQQALYEVTLEAQHKAIAATKAGAHWNEPHDAAVKTIAQGLKDLGLLEGELNEIIETESYKRFYMHRTGHWLGMDVHDVGDYKVGGDWRILEPNMVLTVEPGIYVSPHDSEVARKWRGIGIRIEDDVVVTKKGCDVLTGDVPKAVRDIEKLMKGRAA
ncbi:MAG TPA: Xaa-Pro aminopeptidase, partial [Spongiibacteraceae bacterium]|nr:Xaa-Pro aminopeptidase [Spongiibacteraceae bacterium]